jgi:hypothetical protein
MKSEITLKGEAARKWLRDEGSFLIREKFKRTEISLNLQSKTFPSWSIVHKQSRVFATVDETVITFAEGDIEAIRFAEINKPTFGETYRVEIQLLKPSVSLDYYAAPLSLRHTETFWIQINMEWPETKGWRRINL